MKRKLVSMILLWSVLIMQMVACGSKSSTGSATNTSDSENGNKMETEVVSVNTASEEKSELLQTEDAEKKDLTENIHTNISNGYNVKSYDTVQEFGFTLFKENMDVLNPVMSPVSAYIALTMAGDGAQGNTHQEFLNVLSPDEDMTAVSESIMDILPQKTDYLEVSLSNSAWVDDKFTVNDEWAGQINSYYDAEVYQMDVASEKAMKAMNNWISDSTHEPIDVFFDRPFIYFIMDMENQIPLFIGIMENPDEAVN